MILIHGLGTDIIEVQRIAEKIAKNNGFREAVFSEKEIAYCESKPDKAQHYSARFAAKESFLKALGTGWEYEFNFNEIEILNDLKGKPELFLHGKATKAIENMNMIKIHVSMSHIKEFATAIVIIETNDPGN